MYELNSLSLDNKTDKKLDDTFFQHSIIAQNSDLLLYFSSICMNRFNWQLGNNVIGTQKLIESELFLKGYVGIVRIGDIFYFVPITSVRYNYIYEITEFQVQRQNTGCTPLPAELFGGIFKVDNVNAFVIYNTYDWYLTYNYVMSQIKRLANIQVTYYSLLDKMRQPYIINTTDKTVLSGLTFFSEQRLKDIVVTEKPDTLSVLELNINTAYCDTLREEIDNLFTEIHGILGVNYSRFPKKERLITSEMQSATEVKDLYSTAMLQSRLDGIENLSTLGAEIECKSTLDLIQQNENKNVVVPQTVAHPDGNGNGED